MPTLTGDSLTNYNSAEFKAVFEWNNTLDKFVILDSLYFDSTGKVNGYDYPKNGQDWYVIYEGGFVISYTYDSDNNLTGIDIAKKDICDDDAHSWNTTAPVYERNTDTHIRVCETCGREESQGHNYPTQRVMVGDNNYVYWVNGFNEDGTPIQGNRITTSGFVNFLNNGKDDYNFATNASVTNPHDGSVGYGNGYQSAVFLKEGSAGGNIDYNGDGDTSDVLADAQYHYQSCTVCSQIRKVAHTEDKSGQFKSETTGMLWWQDTGYFCLGCFCGGATQNNEDSSVIEKNGDYDSTTCQHLYDFDTTGSNGFVITKGTSAYELVGYDHQYHYQECYLCGEQRAQAHSWVKTVEVDGGTIYYCAEGCQSFIEGEAFLPDVCLPEGDEANPHDDPNNLKTEPAKAPTCLEEGHSAYQYCEKCEYVVNKEIYAKVPHTLVLVEAKAATCTEEGHGAYYMCTTEILDEDGNPVPRR